MNKVLSGFLLGLFFVLIIALMAFVTVLAYTEKMRWRAVKRLHKVAKDSGIEISKAYLKRNMDKLNLLDLKVLDDWTTLLERKDYAGAIAMWPDARAALQKTDLGLIFGGMGTLLANLINH